MEKDDKDLMDKRERSETLYSRTSSEIVSFDDFEIKKIIGKGTFGKVTNTRYPVLSNILVIGVLGRKHAKWKEVCDEEH
jgi:hypothetical protein